MLAVQRDDIEWGSIATLQLKGKGRKQRPVPLLKTIAADLKRHINKLPLSSKRGKFITRDGSFDRSEAIPRLAYPPGHRSGKIAVALRKTPESWRKFLSLEGIQPNGCFFQPHVRGPNNQLMKNHAKTTVLLAVTLVSPKDAETTKEFLEANPDLAVESKDDAKCEVFFRGLGMLNLFNAAEDPNLSVVTFRDHTHHLRFL